MSRLLPKSLFGQTLLVLVAGLIVSLLAGSWIYSLDREQAVRAVGGFAAAQRITNLTKLVQEAPHEWRERIVAGLSDQNFRVALSAQPPAIVPNDDDVAVAQTIKEFLVDQLSLASEQQPLVSASPPGGPMFGGWRPMMGPGPMMHGFRGFGGFRDLQVAVPLPDGQWLSFATALPESGSAFSRKFLLSMAIMAIVILAVSVWAVRRVTAPLAAVSVAAERLGNDLNAPPMPETGTIETRQASRAFNTMQSRLRSLIENRTRMLAAISHDLRTPLTLLRLRAENVENQQERDKMLATIAEMDSMIGVTLQFARDEATTELRRPTDIAALVQSIVDDMADAGVPAKMQPAEPVVYDCRPDALKRAIRNLLDNAVKYGKAASVAIQTTPKTIEIIIDDEGSGIAEHELSRVFDPFYRLEESRSRETGGVGLGLAIAQSIVQAHRGDLVLSNRPTAGLRAQISLPR
ncbi:MAG: HAMP domain-containing protein [Rhizobiales bacterium]|nr:HAMP domain-containing protein [Hyphomicrobiales bacterium]